MAVPPNRSFQRRLRAGAGAVGIAEVDHPETRRPGGVVQEKNPGAYGVKTYSQVRGVHHGFRIGAMMLDRNITDAFNFYQEGYKFALPTTTLVPFNDVIHLGLEEVWTCAYVAVAGLVDPGELGDNITTMIGVVGNGFAVNIPDAFLMEPALADATIRTGIYRMLGVLTQEQIDALVALYQVRPVWLNADHHNEIPDADFINVVRCIAQHISPQGRSRMMNAYVGTFLMYASQGNITTRKMGKITQDLGAQNIAVTLTSDNIRSLHTVFGKYFDADAASVFFPKWADLLANRCLRLQLCVMQAAHAGLTGLTMIKTCLQAYPDFDWPQLVAKYPGEWNAFLATNEAVGDNAYFGYSPAMSDHGVRRYAPIAYCAKMMLTRVSGDQNMGQLLTMTNMNITNSVWIDDKVQEYARYRARVEVEGARAAVERYWGEEAAPADLGAARNVADDMGAAIPNMGQLAALLAQLGVGGNQHPHGAPPQ